jgi:hypothetical protein
MFCLLLPFTGCKKEQSPMKKIMAGQVQPPTGTQEVKNTEEVKEAKQ